MNPRSAGHAAMPVRTAHRRLLLRAALIGGGAGLLLRPGLAQPPDATPRVIQLTARRFAYEPGEIALKAGERVRVEIIAVDFMHGMNLPALGRRLDLVPGRITPLLLQPLEPGIIEFVCDNFCGEGHEDMHGRFVVSA
jgi:cytochrome c oxidase subunit 2